MIGGARGDVFRLDKVWDGFVDRVFAAAEHGGGGKAETYKFQEVTTGGMEVFPITLEEIDDLLFLRKF